MALSSPERRCALRKIAEDAKITDSELQDRIIANIEADERWFLADLKGHGQATPSKLERDFKRIEREAIQLLKALGLDQYDDPEDGLPPGPIRNLLEFRLSDENGARGERKLRRLVVGMSAVGGKADAPAHPSKSPLVARTGLSSVPHGTHRARISRHDKCRPKRYDCHRSQDERNQPCLATPSSKS